jgi:hypothetical protein
VGNGTRRPLRTALPVPDKFRASSANRGIRRNLGFEGLAFAPDFQTLFVATENALLQDGPVATLTLGSPSRILEYDFASGSVRAEYVYDVAPIPLPPKERDRFADNGISEILALDRHRLLVMERSYAVGAGNNHPAVRGRPLGGHERGATRFARRRELPRRGEEVAVRLRLARHPLDNLEGMTWGPRLVNGNRSLIFVSDDNFRADQITLFVAFEVLRALSVSPPGLARAEKNKERNAVIARSRHRLHVAASLLSRRVRRRMREGDHGCRQPHRCQRLRAEQTGLGIHRIHPHDAAQGSQLRDGMRYDRSSSPASSFSSSHRSETCRPATASMR